MRFHTNALSRTLLATIGLLIPAFALAQQVAQSPLSPAEQTLQQSAEKDRFTFIVFYRGKDAAAQAMSAAIEGGIAPRAGRATLAFVRVTDPGEKKLVNRLGLARAPLPLCVAFAPNGAVTGTFGKAPSADELANAFVTPTMTRCMKALQDGKVALLCVQGAEGAPEPLAVASFQADPRFKDRVATVTLDTTDPAEADFLKQLEIDAANSAKVATVMLAPPGVLVGKYTTEISFEKMAADLHAAGKCCDDPNCKHGKGTGTQANPTTTSTAPATQRR